MSIGHGRGWNSQYGFDMGPPPPGFGPAQPNGIPQFQSFGQPSLAFGWPQPAFAPHAPQFPQFPQHPYPYPFQHAGGQFPAQPPITDGGHPGIHLRNDTGGVGLPPGYNYLFPPEHCKFHLIKSRSPPWQVPINLMDPSSHIKVMVPTTVTVKELMQQLGCTNGDPGKNKLYELTETGGGRFARGLTMVGDNKDRMKEKITEFGWDSSRTGKPGERPVVWLWLTKD